MKKITLIEQLLISLLIISLSLSIFGKNATPIDLHFQVNMAEELTNIKDKNTIGIRGNKAPLSWEKTYVLQDQNGDGIYEGTITLEENTGNLEFKFVHNEVVWELTTENNRVLNLAKKDFDLPLFVWNELPQITQAEIADLTIPKEKLLEDFEIVKSAYTVMHPGLYRYNTPETIEQHLTDLKQELSQDLTIPEAYIAFSRFTAKLKCGHTYANFWNQPKIVKQAITYQPDKVPFHFRIVEDRMIITESAIPDLKRGMEVLAVNGQSWENILTVLLPIMRADGSNDGARLVNLQLLGVDKYEAFDLYFPILFPPQDGQYTLDLVNLNNQQEVTVVVPSMARKARIKSIRGQFPEAIKSTEEELWNFKILDEQTAVLTLQSFAIWNWNLNWKRFLKNAFATLEKENIPNLIIDIRYNGGGADQIPLEVFKHLSQKPITMPARKDLFRFTEFPAKAKPHMGTWDNWFDKAIKKLKPIEEGFYAMNGKITKEQSYLPYKKTYQGKVYLLVSPFNSSATFYMAEAAQRLQIATLVGQETGGNQKGINGGQIYFMNLPNSKIELDIPISGVFPLTEQPDCGYLPDVLVQPTVEDVIKGIDAELEAALKLIKLNFGN